MKFPPALHPFYSTTVFSGRFCTNSFTINRVGGVSTPPTRMRGPPATGRWQYPLGGPVPKKEAQGLHVSLRVSFLSS